MEPVEHLRHTAHWRVAVVVGRSGAAVTALTALCALLCHSNTAGILWLLATVLWCLTSAVVLISITRARREASLTRPWFWRVRWQYLRDVVGLGLPR